MADPSFLDSIFTGVDDIDKGVTEGERRQRRELERIEKEEQEELPLRHRTRRTSQAEIVQSEPQQSDIRVATSTVDSHMLGAMIEQDVVDPATQLQTP